MSICVISELRWYWALVVLTKYNKMANIRIKESFFEYYKAIVLVGEWSNLIKLEGLYDRFDHTPTEIIIS